jgi:phosphoglycerate dehydrogenase-like enzyme
VRALRRNQPAAMCPAASRAAGSDADPHRLYTHTRRFIPPEYNGDVPKMIEALQGVDVLTGPQLIRDAVEVAAGCPDLKLLQITSAGFDTFNFGGPDVMEGLRQHGVIFANNGGSNAVGVAETTIMLMLGVCKNMFELALMARSGRWTDHHTRLDVRGAPGARELSSQTIGIVGFGNIGRMVARYLQGFRCKVLYYDTAELMVGRDGELDAECVLIASWLPGCLAGCRVVALSYLQAQMPSHLHWLTGLGLCLCWCLVVLVQVCAVR